MKEPKKKILIIRFSSIGDVLQSLSIAGRLRRDWPESEIHWVVRDDLSGLVELCSDVNLLHVLRRNEGFWGLFKLSFRLRRYHFSHVYDAHNNLRSHILSWVLRFFRRVQFLRRPIFRLKRFLLFKFKKNLFEMPFSGQRDLLSPLKQWGVSTKAPEPPLLRFSSAMIDRAQAHLKGESSYIALAPSAAYPLKRWPLEYWCELIASLPEEQFVVLGGAQDQFLQPLAELSNVIFLVGQLTLIESAAVVSMSKKLVSNDTGLMHVAEQLGIQCVALMGPAPFGFPSRPTTKVLELQLNCRPCSKHGQGPCVNQQHHLCLRGISPPWVRKELLSEC